MNADKQFYAFKGDSFDKEYYLRCTGDSFDKGYYMRYTGQEGFQSQKKSYYFSYLNLLQYCKVQQEAPFQATAIIFMMLYTA
jgi:hypothetical protein